MKGYVCVLLDSCFAKCWWGIILIHWYSCLLELLLNTCSVILLHLSGKKELSVNFRWKSNVLLALSLMSALLVFCYFLPIRCLHGQTSFCFSYFRRSVQLDCRNIIFHIPGDSPRCWVWTLCADTMDQFGILRIGWNGKEFYQLSLLTPVTGRLCYNSLQLTGQWLGSQRTFA